MQTYEILVQNRAVRGNSKDMTLVRTSVGIDQVHVLFDSAEWLDFPVTITFAQGSDIITQSLLLTALDDSEWVAEATVTVPYEVIDMNGRIRVTLQGTDANGRHIITAAGSPLSVEEAGDVVIGDVPADAPTIDQWQQAYAQAMAAASAAQSVVNDMRSQVEAMIAEAEERILNSLVIPVATTESLGGVMIGDNVTVDEDGRISVTQSSGSGLTVQQATALRNLSALAYQCFDTEFDGAGTLRDNAMAKASALPVATTESPGIVMPDGETIQVSAGGSISAARYELPIATSETLGGIMVGEHMTIDDGALSVPLATPDGFGVVRPDGTTITIDAGVITATGSGEGGYVLPKAAASQLGGIKVGSGLSIDSDGVLSVDLQLADGMSF